MFCGYQEREEYEDELYRMEDEEGTSLSEADSELEFQLYSQLHYVAEDQENQENQPSEVIVIDSGPDIILLSDTTETEDSVCNTKGQKSRSCTKVNSRKVLPHPSSCPSQRKAFKNVAEEVVVVESGSDDSSDSDSVPPFVADLDSDSDSDSDVLENWMLLGRGKEEGDQDIQLNLSVEASSDQLGKNVRATL
uniref:Zinc finger CCHC-type containing 7 n=1 Tax=Pygocentrus nattereri TaxID=42514 RepID=A0A3B4E743_PYGNA